MITHVWSMTFKSAATTEQREALVAAMAGLPGKIDSILSFRCGTTLGLLPGGADVGLVAEFADEQGWRNYIAAPAHLAFVEEHVEPLGVSRTAFQLPTN